MTTREKIISLAVEVGIAFQDEIVAVIAEPPTWNTLEAFYHSLRNEALEEVANAVLEQKYSDPTSKEDRYWNGGVGAALVAIHRIKETK